MKQALFLTEKKIAELSQGLLNLRKEGVYIDDERMNLFSIQAEFRALFHSVDVIWSRTGPMSFLISSQRSRTGSGQLNGNFASGETFCAYPVILFQYGVSAVSADQNAERISENSPQLTPFS